MGLGGSGLTLAAGGRGRNVMTLNLPSFGSPVTMLTPSRDLTLSLFRKSRSLSIEYMDVDMSRSRVDPVVGLEDFYFFFCGLCSIKTWATIKIRSRRIGQIGGHPRERLVLIDRVIRKRKEKRTRKLESLRRYLLITLSHAER
ncbi:UNVERIFIED_CONTAM: hypothetical protein Sindi_3048800 [Sesamum indicum]